MAKKTTIDAVTVSNFSSKLNSDGDTLENMINKLETQLEIFGTGDGDKAYWSGTRALKWFGNAYTNIAKDAKIAAQLDKAIAQLNSYAISAKQTDAGTQSDSDIASLQKELKKALARNEKLEKKVEKLRSKASSASAKTKSSGSTTASSGTSSSANEAVENTKQNTASRKHNGVRFIIYSLLINLYTYS